MSYYETDFVEYYPEESPTHYELYNSQLVPNNRTEIRSEYRPGYGTFIAAFIQVNTPGNWVKFTNWWGLHDLAKLLKYIDDTYVLGGGITGLLDKRWAHPTVDMYFYLSKYTLYHVYEAKVGAHTKRFDAWRYQDCIDWINGGGDGDGNGEPGDTYVETYMGCDIYYTTRIVGGAYYSTCVEVYHHDILDAKKDICEQQDGVWDGSSCSITPPEPTKKHTALSIGVWPTSGTPPYTVTIHAALVSLGEGVPGKLIRLYKNDMQIDSRVTDASGIATFTDTVTKEAEYYVYFAGDSVYEGCSTNGVPPGAGLGGVAILVLLWLILQGGR